MPTIIINTKIGKNKSKIKKVISIRIIGINIISICLKSLTFYSSLLAVPTYLIVFW